jgi:hypothetical protein
VSNPFGRRCGWCAVQLRWWQLNNCRKCKAAINEPIFRTSPCRMGERLRELPDRWRGLSW